MDVPMVDRRERNHAAIWIVALLVAGALVGVAYFLFAEFEHSSWFDSDLRRYLNDNEALVFGGGGLLLWVIIAMLMYRSGAFSRPARAASGWGSGQDDIRPVSPPRPAAGSGFVRPGGDHPTFLVVINQGRRACTGDLILADRRLYFVCYRDVSVAKAGAGKAVAKQFGLLGVLIHTLASRGGKKNRDQEVEQARAEFSGLSLDDQVSRNEYSFSFTPEQIELISKSSWTGNKIQAGGTSYIIAQIDEKAFWDLKSWCENLGIATKGF